MRIGFIGLGVMGGADEQGVAVPASALGEQLWRAANAALGPSACVLDVARWYERATGLELKD